VVRVGCHRPALDVADVVTRLRDINMEHARDLTTSSLTRRGPDLDQWIPDEPGVATRLFDEVGTGGILVDMIIQTTRGAMARRASAYAPREQIPKAVELANG